MPDMPTTPGAIQDTGFTALTGDANLFVLATAPGEETRCCGTLIAEACARGRPPFVAVLTDGSAAPAPGLPKVPDARAAVWERRARRAVDALGVPPEWFLMLGLHDDTVPEGGRKFEALVGAVTLIMWRRDCNTLVAPASDGTGTGDAARCHAVASAVAARSGVGLLLYRSPGGAWGGQALRSPRAARRRTAALACYPGLPMHEEAYVATAGALADGAT